jgi:hypothetical protein
MCHYVIQQWSISKNSPANELPKLRARAVVGAKCAWAIRQQSAMKLFQSLIKKAMREIEQLTDLPGSKRQQR